MYGNRSQQALSVSETPRFLPYKPTQNMMKGAVVVREGPVARSQLPVFGRKNSRSPRLKQAVLIMHNVNPLDTPAFVCIFTI